jgi:YrbI family 3-deoxy-D-manno-octulosonate 8-phosphate phosphatase
MDEGIRRPRHPELAAIRLLVLDFDGVMTDNRVLVDQDGHEAVWCHRGDGWGIARLRDAGLPVVVLSTETNPVVAARCRKLNIPYVQGSNDKRSALERLAHEAGVDQTQIAYVGNDVNDLECLKWVTFSIVVADAVDEVRSFARMVTSTPGGYGAVREVADWILEAQTW